MDECETPADLFIRISFIVFIIIGTIAGAFLWGYNMREKMLWGEADEWCFHFGRGVDPTINTGNRDPVAYYFNGTYLCANNATGGFK